MDEHIIFAPDPRKFENTLIGVPDDEVFEANHKHGISIQLGQADGTYGIDGSHSAFLSREEDGYWRLLLVNAEKGHYEVHLKFTDTYNICEVCNEIERRFKDGYFEVVYPEDGTKPFLQSK